MLDSHFERCVANLLCFQPNLWIHYPSGNWLGESFHDIQHSFGLPGRYALSGRMRSRSPTLTEGNLGVQCCFDSPMDLLSLQTNGIHSCASPSLLWSCSCYSSICWNGCGGWKDTRSWAFLLHSAVQLGRFVLSGPSKFNEGHLRSRTD